MARVDRYRNSKGLIWLNVASSIYALEDFANLDNHVFLWLSRLPPLLTDLFPKRYRNYIDSYRKAGRIAPMFRHDCRKPLALPENVVDHVLCSHFLEHVYPDECDSILGDFHRVLKDGATLHVIVPDIAVQVDEYVRLRNAGEARAADAFIKSTVLTTENRGSLKYRLLEAAGAFGLQHRWMYDHESIAAKIAEAGFGILDTNETPSRMFRDGDDSVHIVARKVSRP